MPTTRVYHVFLANFLIMVLSAAAFAQIEKERDYAADDPAATWKEQDSVDGRWNETDIGPFIASVLPTPGGTVAKGLSIRVGDKQQGAVCYDLETMAMKAAWTGGFVKFNPRRYGIVSSPTIAGSVKFHTSAAGWSNTTPDDSALLDKAVPSDVEFRGLYHHGNRVVLEYIVDGVVVRESPWAESIDSKLYFTRTLQIAPHKKSFLIALASAPPDSGGLAGDPLEKQPKNLLTTKFVRDKVPYLVACQGDGPFTPVSGIAFVDNVILLLAPEEKTTTFHISLAADVDNDSALPPFSSAKLANLVMPGAPMWGNLLVTKGEIGNGDAPYTIDTITIPFDNPYKALMFISGHDFFSNGDMAACTLHGDVWLIRGVDERLDKVTWKRFATGLHQPLGLRIVDDEVYVLGRDQITRLHDRNGDGEADYYENFNNGGATSTSGHDFAACLETDPDGNFYYIRAHEGVCRVSKDGSRHESIAAGFRNPIGLGVGPDGTITAAPQEGNWTPSSLIAEVKEGGYYGFGGPKVTPQRPLGYDPPLCWIPRENDSSSGGQVWVTSDRWGALAGQMLHLSYGRCQMCLVLREHVGGVAQGGTVKFPLFFESGVMRGRFSPRDGQLYLSGLRGWQCAATKDGCIQRVRYTGKPVDMPVGLHVRRDGLEIKFTRPLDEKSAADPDNYFVEQWNYHYSGNYGSKDYKVSDPKRTGRDEVEVFDARLLDDRTVFLELDDVQPVMQMGISYAIKAADGAEIRRTIYNTINAVPSAE